MASRTVTLSRKRWKLEYVRHVDISRSHHSDADAPDEPNKKIQVRRAYLRPGKDLLLLELLLHEGLHCEQWNLDEDAVKLFAKDLARLLWGEGFRRDPSLPVPKHHKA